MPIRRSLFCGRQPSRSTVSLSLSVHECHPDSGQRTAAGGQGDAILSNFQSVLDAATQALSGVPVPGIANALPVLQALAQAVLVSYITPSQQTQLMYNRQCERMSKKRRT